MESDRQLCPARRYDPSEPLYCRQRLRHCGHFQRNKRQGQRAVCPHADPCAGSWYYFICLFHAGRRRYHCRAARAAADLLGDLHSPAVPLRRYPKRQPFLAGVQLPAVFHPACGDLQNSVYHDPGQDHEHPAEQDLAYLNGPAARSHHGLHVWPDRRSVGGSGCCAAVSVYFRHYGVCRRREPFVVPRCVCGAACSFSIFVAVSQLRPAQPYLGSV